VRGENRYEDRSDHPRPEPAGAPAEFVDTSDTNLPGEQLGDEPPAEADTEPHDRRRSS
jgi:hypothetical protein